MVVIVVVYSFSIIKMRRTSPTMMIHRIPTMILGLRHGILEASFFERKFSGQKSSS